MGRELIIVGGSYAACQIAASARENGYNDKIRILTDEDQLPYHRPPLSKAFLLGTADESGLPLKADAFYRDQAIDVVFKTRVESIDTATRTLSLAQQPGMKYDNLALAVGAQARKLKVPGSDLNGVVYLRSLADAIALKQKAAAATEVVVVGGGFIGLEVASALVQRGKNVTVIETQDRLLSRVVAPGVADFLAAAHEKKGVKLRTRSQVTEIRGDGGNAQAVVCNDGSVTPADIVVVGIGAIPNTGLAEIAGLKCSDGIVVDGYSRTSDPHIVAAGDCAFFANRFAPAGVRLESVQNALDQSKTAGASIAGVNKLYDAVPWFWSDQYNFKLQIAGLSNGYDSFVERKFSDRGSEQLSVFYFRQNTCVAVDSINRPRDHMSARKLFSQRTVTRRDLMSVEFDPSALLSKPHP